MLIFDPQVTLKMSSSDHLDSSDSGSTHSLMSSQGPPQPPQSESEPMEDSNYESTPPPPSPPRAPVQPPAPAPPPASRAPPALRPMGPRTKVTARKTVRHPPIWPNGRRDMRSEPVSQSTYHVGGPSSAPSRAGPPLHAAARATVDVESYERIWTAIRDHDEEFLRLSSTEYNTYSQLHRNTQLTQQLEVEVARLRREVKDLKARKGLLATIWDWLRRTK